MEYIPQVLFTLSFFFIFSHPDQQPVLWGKWRQQQQRQRKQLAWEMGIKDVKERNFLSVQLAAAPRGAPLIYFLSFFLYPAAFMAHLQKWQFLFRGQEREAQSSQKVQGC